MNPYVLIAALLLLAAGATYGTYEKGQAESWHQKYSSLQASYKTAAVAAETHAQAVEAKQAADLKEKTTDALSQASSATSKANAVRAVYLKKLAALNNQPKLDLGHQCSLVPIPADLVPQ